MSIADEIQKLAQLRANGTLTEAEFERAKARLFETGPSAGHNGDAGAPEQVPILRRAQRDRWIGGVCGGLGHYTGLESWIWRVLFTAAVLFAGFGILPYVVLWIFVPTDESI